MSKRIYRIDGFLLASDWRPKGGIFFVVRGGDNERDHKEYCESQKKRLLDENDDNYTSWVFTGEVYRKDSHFDPYTTVIAFRIRDVW